MNLSEVPSMHLATATSCFAVIFTLFYIFLAAQVIKHRRSRLISIGDGGSEEISRAIRAHANFAEYVPLALILMMLFEIQGAPTWEVSIYGGLLLIGRLMHARGLTVLKDRKLPFRFWGMVLTFTSLIGLAARLLILTLL